MTGGAAVRSNPVVSLSNHGVANITVLRQAQDEVARVGRFALLQAAL
jgi:hypothetical protein